MTPAWALPGIDQTWPWGPDWSWLSRANTDIPYKPQAPSPSLSSQLPPAGSWWLLCPQTEPVSDTEAEEPRAMRSLGALLLLLTACLAVRASPVPTPPANIQVQENFDLSRVRLACLAAMAGCPSC